MKNIKVLVFVLSSILLISCSTLQGYKNPVKEEALFGIIIDEKNQPVSEYKIVCEDSRKEMKTAITNSSGYFVIEAVLTGKILICGSRDGYVELLNEEIDFVGNKKVYCWQIKSIEGVLEEVERLICAGEYQQGLNAFSGLKVKYGSEEYKLLKQLKTLLKKKNRESGEVMNDKNLEV